MHTVVAWLKELWMYDVAARCIFGMIPGVMLLCSVQVVVFCLMFLQLLMPRPRLLIHAITRTCRWWQH